MITRAGSDAPCTRPCQSQKGLTSTCKSCPLLLLLLLLLVLVLVLLRLLHHGPPPSLRCPPCPGPGPGPGRPTPQILTRTSRHTRLDNLVRPSSAVLHPGSSTSTLGINPIHAFFFCTYIRKAGLPGKGGTWDPTDVWASYQAAPSLLILSCQALSTAFTIQFIGGSLRR
jgi:hypothetical protein